MLTVEARAWIERLLTEVDSAIGLYDSESFDKAAENARSLAAAARDFLAAAEVSAPAVLPTCGDCGHCSVRDRAVCEHDSLDGEPARVVEREDEPPSWCPLRGTQ